MRTLRHLPLSALAALLATTAAFAETSAPTDLSGTWTMTIQGKAPPGKNFARLTFEGEGEETTVVLAGKGGELTEPVEVDGDAFRFEHETPGKKGAVALFTGSVRGDLMGGEVDMGRRGKSSWQAIREGDGVFDLSGSWTFFQKGLPRDYANLTKLYFSQESSDLVATFVTGDEETVCRGYLDGASLGFEYSRTTGDQAIGASYVGTVSGHLMRGEVDMGELGKSTWQATRDDG